MSEENEIVTNNCVHCGAKIDKSKTYCPQCGKLVIKIKPTEKQPTVIKKEIPTRTCSNCGSHITSSVLEQCPICNSKLDKIPKELKSSVSPTPQKKRA